MRKKFLLFFAPLLISLLIFPALADNKTNAVYFDLVFSSATQAKISDARLVEETPPISEDSVQGGSMEGGTGSFTTSLLSEGKPVVSYSFNVFSGIKSGFTSPVYFLVPENSQGKLMEVTLSYNSRELDRQNIIYCGDGRCDKGEGLLVCPADCGSRVRLAPQQAAKTVPYFVGGGLLLLLAISVIIVARKAQ
jgi:hypothetical protein